jgi:endonuclease/exonuclease/phosphatase family metal-dependent hydrolase
MSFNTMCDYCGSKKYAEFNERINYLKETIQKHAPDLISLQEVRTGDQVRKMMGDHKNYHLIYTDSFLMSYADPALIINKNRFDLIENGHFWLGPGEGFSIGWKYALPRQVHWAKIKDKITKNEFLFVGSHFDNRVENMLGSAKKVNNFISKFKIPIIFAADTNITPDFEAYELLLKEKLINSYDKVEKYQISGPQNTPEKDLCYHRKGEEISQCRVDHILLSKEHHWEVKEWMIDTNRFGKKKAFPSDHRAIMATIELN